MLTYKHLLHAFEAAGAHQGVVYLSAPITSGLRELALMRELDVTSHELQRLHRERWKNEVIQQNESVAHAHADRLRAREPGRLVVDPSWMVVVGWEQSDYLGFWISLMECHARQLVAAPGWEYSKGARREVAFAVVLTCPVVDVDGGEVTSDDIKSADQRARESLVSDGWSEDEVHGYLPPMDYVHRPVIASSAGSQTFDWLVGERQYQVTKFGTAADDAHTAEGLDGDSWWWRQLTTYFHRSRVLGLETPLGRQALAKFVATGCGLVESVVRMHGPLPAPGVPSGETHGGL